MRSNCSALLSQQRAFRRHTRAQAVRVAHCTRSNIAAGTDTTTQGQQHPDLPTAKAEGFSAAPR